eukprot:scaffold131875_cov24-Tisochrysis_lutea.AAC.2
MTHEKAAHGCLDEDSRLTLDLPVPRTLLGLPILLFLHLLVEHVAEDIVERILRCGATHGISPPLDISPAEVGYVGSCFPPTIIAPSLSPLQAGRAPPPTFFSPPPPVSGPLRPRLLAVVRTPPLFCAPLLPPARLSIGPPAPPPLLSAVPRPPPPPLSAEPQSQQPPLGAFWPPLLCAPARRPLARRPAQRAPALLVRQLPPPPPPWPRAALPRGALPRVPLHRRAHGPPRPPGAPTSESAASGVRALEPYPRRLHAEPPTMRPANWSRPSAPARLRGV